MQLIQNLTLVLTLCAFAIPKSTLAQAKWVLDTADLELFKGDDVEEEEFKLHGKIVARDEKDKDGNVITKAFLEDDDGGLIELPCESKDKDAGLLKKAGNKAFKGKESCFNFVGQKVQVVGQAQSVFRKGKRYSKVAKIAGIGPF